MEFRKINPWIFAIGTFLIISHKHFITDKILSLSITIISVLGIIYAIYTSDMGQKSKIAIIALYILFLIIYCVLLFR